MKNNILKILVIVAFVLGTLLFLKNRSIEQKTLITNQTNGRTNTKSNWETKTEEQAGVTVVVTPTDLSLNSKEWKFDVEMNTHSVELRNPMSSFILIDDSGKEYKPTNWDGPTEGHHMNGVLTFSKITPLPKTIELKIAGIGDVVRNFSWQPK